eukprot:evm.model.scf_282EXC.8 EVM.evm.TU.scf_282EXC.8   scf_282EXC:79227-87020(+)
MCTSSAVTYGAAKCEAICAEQSEIERRLPPGPKLSEGNIATQWGTVLLIQIHANLKELTPPGVARALGIFSTCMHDAIAIESPELETAIVNSKSANKRRQKAGLPPLEDATILDGFDVTAALNGAAYTAIEEMFSGKSSMGVAIDYALWVSSGVLSTADPDNSEDVVGQILSNYDTNQQMSFELGQDVCREVIAVFTQDGFDVLGQPLEGTTSDYKPVNKPQATPGITDCTAEMKDRDYWQPLCVPVAYGSDNCNVQEYLSPGAGNMTTFGIENGKSVIPRTGPPTIRDGQKKEWKKQAREVIEYSAGLNDVNKLKAEYWADGPDSTFPPGHWYRIAIEAAVNQGLDTVETVKVLTIVGLALNDAGVGSWSAKVYYDSVRPLQMIQCGFKGKEIEAWVAPYMGVSTVKSSEWQPYQAATFVTPPFSGFVSGHSTFSAAAAGALKHYFGTDEYLGPKCQMIPKGTSKFEGRIRPGEQFYVAGVTDVPNQGPRTQGYVPADDVVLCWETWDEAAEDAGISRLHGGIHILADHTAGGEMGAKIADAVAKRTAQMWLNRRR